MTRVRLARRAEDESTVTLGATATFPDGPLQLRYPSRTGALLRIDGVAAGAFDLKHETIGLAAIGGEHDLTLEVERRSLPTSGLPSGDGIAWRLMLARAEQKPHESLEFGPAAAAPGGREIDVPLIGHSHLDIAWLWTYDQARRKAMRTFSTALRQMDVDARYIYAQSQPQLYRWVFAADASFAERIRARLGRGWDASVAPMWVEPDLHAPSGESILRQFAHGIRWMREQLSIEPSVLWLPDTFGFPATLPTLAVHAGVTSFLTTKLEWNDTTRWAFPQFRWIGDDGSALVSAMVDGYDGDVTAKRIATARERGELVIVGHGDGGGGATDADLASIAMNCDPWTTAADWFASVAADTLPEYRGELYLETHRGTYTTHRDVKRRNAQLERALAHAEEAAAWCVAVRAPKSVRASLVEDLRTAWQIVLRGQFHDVMAGTAVSAVYVDVAAEHDRAAAIVARVAASAASILPRSDIVAAAPASVLPLRDGDTWLVRNAFVRARIREDGTIVDFGTADGPNVAASLNAIAAYHDRPKHWDAWNLDRGYAAEPVAVKPAGTAIEDGDLVVHLAVGKTSRLTMHVSLDENEPWLRIACAVAWNEDHVVLRAEHQVRTTARDVRFGQPHGTILRTAYAVTDGERAQYEVPAQRWAHAGDDNSGLAIFASDLYGWSARGSDGTAINVGTSLLRSPRWPDPMCDRGETELAYALVPTAGASIAALEHAWSAYVGDDRVRLFACDDPGVQIVATYPSDDAAGVIVRVRECDGDVHQVRLRCGGRMNAVACVDAVERDIGGSAAIEEEAIVFALEPFALRSFCVRF